MESVFGLGSVVLLFKGRRPHDFLTTLTTRNFQFLAFYVPASPNLWRIGFLPNASHIPQEFSFCGFLPFRRIHNFEDENSSDSWLERLNVKRSIRRSLFDSVTSDRNMQNS